MSSIDVLGDLRRILIRVHFSLPVAKYNLLDVFISSYGKKDCVSQFASIVDRYQGSFLRGGGVIRKRFRKGDCLRSGLLILSIETNIMSFS